MTLQNPFRLRRPRWARMGATVALGLVATPSAADPTWFPKTSDPSRLGPTSVEIVTDDELLFQAPSSEARRRGAARIGARLPVFGWQQASGCAGRWLLVGAFAWLCDDRVRASDWPPDAANAQRRFEGGLPFRYHFVGDEGSFGYSSLPRAEEGTPDRQFEPGFAVAVADVQTKPSTGEPFAQSSHGLWLPLRDLSPANPSAFEGVVLESDDELASLAWTIADTSVYANPKSPTPTTTLTPLTRVRVREVVKSGRGALAALSPSGFVRLSSIARPARHPPPSDVLPEERWIAVDLASQTLLAYRGPHPWFATLVSTGRGSDGSAEATPRGEFRIWVKLVSTDMTNLEDLDANSYYAIEDVPWVMFFEDGYGLHGAFWHRSFGTQRSHGCVNLSPRDAERLFHWAGPRLPSGFRAVHPTPHDPGTRVVVF